MTKRKSLTPLQALIFRLFLSAAVVVISTIFVFGQSAAPADQSYSQFDPVLRIIGWVGVIMAAVTHTVTNIWTLIRGKNYEQLKEACANYKELAESRSVVNADLRAELAVVRQDNMRLEMQNETLAEQKLRK